MSGLTDADARFVEQAMDRAYEAGADRWAYDLAVTLLDQRDNHGASFARLGEVALELAAARMQAGQVPGEWFGEGAGG